MVHMDKGFEGSFDCQGCKDNLVSYMTKRMVRTGGRLNYSVEGQSVRRAAVRRESQNA